jgi:hypothetical protein
MVENLSPSAKVSISAFSLLVITAAVFVSAVYMRDIAYPYLDNSRAAVPEVAGVSAERNRPHNEGELVVPPASIRVSDEGNGSAAIYLRVGSFASISSLDLSFSLQGELALERIACEEGYVCETVDYGEGLLQVVIRTSPDTEGVLWSGESKVATVGYVVGTSGTLEMNRYAQKGSEVKEYSTGKNLLNGETLLFSIGN